MSNFNKKANRMSNEQEALRKFKLEKDSSKNLKDTLNATAVYWMRGK